MFTYQLQFASADLPWEHASDAHCEIARDGAEAVIRRLFGEKTVIEWLDSETVRFTSHRNMPAGVFPGLIQV